MLIEPGNELTLAIIPRDHQLAEGLPRRLQAQVLPCCRLQQAWVEIVEIIACVHSASIPRYVQILNI